MGVAARLLKQEGIPLFSEQEWPEALALIGISPDGQP